MKKAFRDRYNRELAILYEQSAEFAAAYPGIADRLGGLLQENLDPAVAGLLEGTAFMAARVQTRMDEEFRTFSEEMLEQILPGILAPIPSAMLVQAALPLDNKDLAQGVHFPRGDYLDARFRDADRRVSCRFRLSSDLTLWPVAIGDLRYLSAAGPISALGRDAAEGTKAGLQINLGTVSSSGTPGSGAAFAELPIDTLPLHFTGPYSEAVALYEQVISGRIRASLRWLDSRGDPVFVTLRPDQIDQIGFTEEEQLFDHQDRIFSGFALLRDAFVFPRKFLGLRLTGLRRLLSRIKTSEVQLLLEFDSTDETLAARLGPDDVRLHCAPAVNLFEDSCSSIRLDDRHHDYVVTPESSPVTHYEVLGITDVYAHYSGGQTRVRVHPLYAPVPGDINPREALYYTTRRRRRRLTDREKRFGTSRYRYLGTETFISIYEPPSDDPAYRLQVRLLCSNRHLTEYLPIAEGKDDFFMCDDTTVNLSCVAGPTPPRDAVPELERKGPLRAKAGDNYWRLISYLGLASFGLGDRSGTRAADALRELLSLFVDLTDTVTEAQLSGIKDVGTRPVVRTIQRDGAYHAARGLEVTITFDEDEFEGSGIALLAAVLDRFLAEYAAVNSFTQCVVHSLQRGTVHTFPPRTGTGPLL